jgi:hypothetical protein
MSTVGVDSLFLKVVLQTVDTRGATVELVLRKSVGKSLF